MSDANRQRILDVVRAEKQPIVDFTRELVAVATENPPGARYRQCVDVLTRELTKVYIDFEVVEVPGETQTPTKGDFATAATAVGAAGFVGAAGVASSRADLTSAWNTWRRGRR